MKRFLVFSGQYYETGGGWTDFNCSFEYFEEALEYVKKERASEHHWWQIVDSNLGQIVKENE